MFWALRPQLGAESWGRGAWLSLTTPLQTVTTGQCCIFHSLLTTIKKPCPQAPTAGLDGLFCFSMMDRDPVEPQAKVNPFLAHVCPTGCFVAGVRGQRSTAESRLVCQANGCRNQRKRVLSQTWRSSYPLPALTADQGISLKVHFPSREHASVTDVALGAFWVTMTVPSPSSDTDVRMAAVFGMGRLFLNKVSKVTTLILTSGERNPHSMHICRSQLYCKDFGHVTEIDNSFSAGQSSGWRSGLPMFQFASEEGGVDFCGKFNSWWLENSFLLRVPRFCSIQTFNCLGEGHVCYQEQSAFLGTHWLMIGSHLISKYPQTPTLRIFG